MFSNKLNLNTILFFGTLPTLILELAMSLVHNII